MLRAHPCLAIMHLIDERRPTPPLPKRTKTSENDD
jgi:hypothetical protein